jgi:hypothetical protein
MTASQIDQTIRQLKLGALHRCRERIDEAKKQPAASGKDEQRYIEYCGLTGHLKRMRGL